MKRLEIVLFGGRSGIRWPGRLSALVLLACLAVIGCERPSQGGDTGGVDLSPDERPVYSLRVGDAQEMAILRQETDIEFVRRDGAVVYFRADEATRNSLGAFGYDVGQANPHRVESRTVRLLRDGRKRPDFDALGIRYLNREEGYWVVSGDLATLRSLVDSGWSIAPVRESEPMPRPVKITVPNLEAVQWVNELGVEIWAVRPAAGNQGDDGAQMEIRSAQSVSRDVVSDRLAAREERLKAGPVVIEGAAFDAQIEALEAEDYPVETLEGNQGGAQ